MLASPAVPTEPSPAKVHFGAERYVGALVSRLERYFEAQQRHGPPDERAMHGPSRGDQALVVGIYGPWGCGKTTWLRSVETEFRERQSRMSEERRAEQQRITVPVFFNAWQFEREPHLVVPMLKTAEASVRQFLSEYAPRETKPKAVWRWARRSMLMLGDAALALASGFKGELSFGRIGAATGAKVGLDAGKSIDVFLARRKERQETGSAAPSPLEAYESLYFDLRSYMRALTGRGERPEALKWIEEAQEGLGHKENDARRLAIQELERKREEITGEIGRLGIWSRKRRGRTLASDREAVDQQIAKLTKALPPSGGSSPAQLDENGDHRLDLLFLIDDLDRCLPEKAVEVLESIKLFLEVPGCAFVLGVDDEVIERGILHRYRDYVPTGDTAESARSEGTGRGAPISGAEYLEKIVHLPVRVPPLVEAETRTFLQQEYPKLFRASARARFPREDDRLALEERAQLVPETAPESPGWNDELLELFERCVPGVPRKLIRAAELFSLLDEVARELVDERSFGAADYEPLLLARLVLLQLFSPEVYRIGARREGRQFLDDLKELKGVGLDLEIQRLRR